MNSDILFSSNMTSAAVEAYLLGVPIISYVEKNSINLSPLKDKKDVIFLSDINQISKTFKILKRKKNINFKNKNFIFLDNNLKKWDKILKESK